MNKWLKWLSIISDIARILYLTGAIKGKEKDRVVGVSDVLKDHTEKQQ